MNAILTIGGILAFVIGAGLVLGAWPDIAYLRQFHPSHYSEMPDYKAFRLELAIGIFLLAGGIIAVAAGVFGHNG